MFSHCYAFSLFIGCCLSHCLIMWAVSECKHCVHIYCNGAEGLANWCTKLKAEAPWRFSWGVYSTRKPNFSKATAKSKTHRTQCFRSAWLSEFGLAILRQGQPNNEVLCLHSCDQALFSQLAVSFVFTSAWSPGFQIWSSDSCQSTHTNWES